MLGENIQKHAKTNKARPPETNKSETTPANNNNPYQVPPLPRPTTPKHHQKGQEQQNEKYRRDKEKGE